jgi:hypothetical protein
MSRRLFYRNINARDNLEIFLVSAVTALLSLRFYLYLTGYPQLGNAKLHIAHMLVGGLLMLAANIINLSFLGNRAKRLSSVVGGAGFGIFIDELGKFITKNNNYFFRPTVGLIYAIFAILYLVINSLTKRASLSNDEYLLNALQQFEEAVRSDMDNHEKSSMSRLLAQADQSNPITTQLKYMIEHVEPVNSQLSWYQRRLNRAGQIYDKFWAKRRSNQYVAAAFIIEALIFLGVVIGSLAHSFDDIRDLLRHTDAYSTILLIGQLASSLVASAFAVIGAARLTKSRLEAFEWFRRALLTNVFLTEFFIFSRVQFAALPGFFINLVMLIVLRSAIFQERDR